MSHRTASLGLGRSQPGVTIAILNKNRHVSCLGRVQTLGDHYEWIARAITDLSHDCGDVGPNSIIEMPSPKLLAICYFSFIMVYGLLRGAKRTDLKWKNMYRNTY